MKPRHNTCSDQDCFACSGTVCKILTYAFRKRPCPFRKTREEVEAGRTEARERLERIGRTDLIEYYHVNNNGYEL